MCFTLVQVKAGQTLVSYIEKVTFLKPFSLNSLFGTNPFLASIWLNCCLRSLTIWCSGTRRSQTLQIQGQGWFRGIVQISKVQVKDDITRVIKDVGSGFIFFDTPRSKSQKR